MTAGARKRGILVTVAIALGAGGAFLPMRAAPPPPDPVQGELPAPPGDAVVVAADPGVERTVARGGWAPARPGDALAVADTIRTGSAGTAEIALGRGSHVTVSQGTEVTVRELTAAVQRVGLLRGRIGVNIEADGTRVVRVEDAASAIRVSASAGRLGVLATRNSLAVAAQEGRAVLESGGRAVEIDAGHQSTAWRGAPPAAPAPIPRALLMRVVHALDERRAGICNVQQVDLAAEVTVNGATVETPADGRLVIRVAPRDRSRGADVVVRHASGAVERRRVRCWKDEADVTGMEVRWDGR